MRLTIRRLGEKIKGNIETKPEVVAVKKKKIKLFEVLDQGKSYIEGYDINIVQDVNMATVPDIPTKNEMKIFDNNEISV
jgi:hypothetical protein